jgi:hypothetical protein
MSPTRHCLAVVTACLASGAATAANIVPNGSFEIGGFANTTCNYMLLAPGDSSLAGWTVANQSIAWGRSTCDGFAGSDGPSFVDLSAFGANSPNGTLAQLLGTTTGVQYDFAIDQQGGAVTVTLGGTPLTLTSGSVVGGWTRYTSSFTATGNSTLLAVSNAAPGNPVVFIDNVQLSAVVPVPAAGWLLLAGLGALGTASSRRQRGGSC